MKDNKANPAGLKKKGFFKKIVEKFDKKIQEKAAKSQCCCNNNKGKTCCN